jgi:sulfite exporter TauE/SafE
MDKEQCEESCCDMEPVSAKWSEFKTAIPLTAAFLVFFVFLQKFGLVDIKSTGTVSFGTALFVGLVASLSTCMAVVGGLVLSMSATFAKEGNKVLPHIFFHGGRLVSFFILGGMLGSIGAILSISMRASAILGIIIALVMVILGLNLLDVFPWARKLQPSLPGFLSRFTVSAARMNGMLTPVLVGILTFFLPCGFTQSMQIYALGTGNFMTGAVTMLAFAIGTLPVLALMSFGSARMKESPKAGVFFKVAGLIVISFALFNIFNNSAVVFGGAGFSGSRYTQPADVISSNVMMEGSKQIVLISVRGGYSPRISTAKAGVPTIFRMRTSGSFDCSSSVAIPNLKIWKNLALSGDTDIEIPAQVAGTRLEAMCSMGMYRFDVNFRE